MWLYKWKLLNVCNELVKFSGHRHSGRGDILLICHMILQGHVIKGSCDFLAKNPLVLVTTLYKVWWP